VAYALVLGVGLFHYVFRIILKLPSSSMYSSYLLQYEDENGTTSILFVLGPPAVRTSFAFIFSMDKTARCSGRLKDRDLFAKASIQTTSERQKHMNNQIGYSVGVQNLKSPLSSQSLPWAEGTEQVICRQARRVKIYFEIRVLATNAYMRYRLVVV